MVKVDQLLPMIYYGNNDLIIGTMKFYFKEKWLENIYECFKNGYSEMSQINLSLAEIGIEQDMKDLALYEARLLGRESLWW